jgi:NADH-quinone oxidoreductase subunit E
MSEKTAETFILSEAVKHDIDRWLLKYPDDQRQSAVVEALLLTQAQNQGWLSVPAMDAVAEYLKIPPIVVYEAATFYDMTNLAPVGKHKISLCTNVSCMLRGSEEIAACIKKRLNITFNETTADGQFTLREVECMGACAGAPMCQIDDQQYHESLTPQTMLDLIDALDTTGGGHA